MIAVTGDTHGEEERFLYLDSVINKNLHKGDYLIICGDFGYVYDDSFRERKYLDQLAESEFVILFCDGNHENFDLLEEYPIEEWKGGKVHVIRRDDEGIPKIIHLMRGQIFNIDGKSIFTFGGAYSDDKDMRKIHYSWWPQEMPDYDEMKEAAENLKKYDYKVDYIITHTAPEETMNSLEQEHSKERVLNTFLEWIRKNVAYKHWYMGHLHKELDLWRKQTILWFLLRNIETNEIIGAEEDYSDVMLLK